MINCEEITKFSDLSGNVILEKTYSGSPVQTEVISGSSISSSSNHPGGAEQKHMYCLPARQTGSLLSRWTTRSTAASPPARANKIEWHRSAVRRAAGCRWQVLACGTTSRSRLCTRQNDAPPHTVSAPRSRVRTVREGGGKQESDGNARSSLAVRSPLCTLPARDGLKPGGLKTVVVKTHSESIDTVQFSFARK